MGRGKNKARQATLVALNKSLGTRRMVEARPGDIFYDWDGEICLHDPSGRNGGTISVFNVYEDNEMIASLSIEEIRGKEELKWLRDFEGPYFNDITETSERFLILHSIFTRNDKRNQGVFRNLLMRLLAEANRLPCAPVFIELWSNWPLEQWFEQHQKDDLLD